MSEMVERVAEAIWQIEMKEGEGVARFPHEYWTLAARAAIEAMREPDAEMLKAAPLAEHNHFWPSTSPTSHTWQSLPAMLVKKLYTSMIDQALK
jgi:hypothetical protein